MTEEPHMWRHWRDKYGIAEALREYFPETLNQNQELRAALTQLRSAEVLIDKIMSDAAEAAEDAFYD